MQTLQSTRETTEDVDSGHAVTGRSPYEHIYVIRTSRILSPDRTLPDRWLSDMNERRKLGLGTAVVHGKKFSRQRPRSTMPWNHRGEVRARTHGTKLPSRSEALHFINSAKSSSTTSVLTQRQIGQSFGLKSFFSAGAERDWTAWIWPAKKLLNCSQSVLFSSDSVYHFQPELQLKPDHKVRTVYRKWEELVSKYTTAKTDELAAGWYSNPDGNSTPPSLWLLSEMYRV